MAYMDVTVQGCIDLYKEGYETVLNDGEVKCFEKSDSCSSDCNDGCSDSESDQM